MSHWRARLSTAVLRGRGITLSREETKTIYRDLNQPNKRVNWMDLAVDFLIAAKAEKMVVFTNATDIHGMVITRSKTEKG